MDESNLGNGIYWNKRVGNDHIKTQISSGKNRNLFISMLIIPNEEYEYYLRSSDNIWKEAASSENIKIIKSTVSELKAAEKEYITPNKNMDIILKHFSIHGSIEDIKENKKISESLININSNNLKPNKDKSKGNITNDTKILNIPRTSLYYIQKFTLIDKIIKNFKAIFTTVVNIAFYYVK